MDSLIGMFHIDIRLLLAQAVNFGIIFGLLYFFIFKPLVGTMDERSRKIDKSLKEAEDMSKKMEAAEKEQKKIIAEAKKEASAILAEAREMGEKKRDEMVESAKKRIGGIIDGEKVKMREEKDKILQEIKGEVGGLIVEAIKKIAGGDIGSRLDKSLIDRMVAGDGKRKS